MNIQNQYWRYLRAALFCGFALSGICSLHESLRVYTLLDRAAELDAIRPRLGDAERLSVHQHSMELYFFAALSFCFAYGIYPTRASKAAPL